MPERPDAAGAAAGVQLCDAIEALSEGFALFDEVGRLVVCNAQLRRFNPQIAVLLQPGVDWELLLRELHARGAVGEDGMRRLLDLERIVVPGEPPKSLDIEVYTGHVMAVTLAATRHGGFVLTQRDVTARHRLEAADRDADLLLRSVLESCPANVLMSRLDDAQVLYRSPAATTLLGTICSDKAIFASREERADFLTALLPNGRVDVLHFTAIAEDGAYFPAAISARLIDFRGDDVIVATVADLSRERAMQEELAAQRETIFQNEKMSALGEMLAGVAHELNNPLSVVVGHAQILVEEATDNAVQRRVEKIRQAAERCSRIVRSFLSLSRLSPVTLAPVDLNAVIATALETVRNRAPALTSTVETTLVEMLPTALADADQIVQVVVNLVVNADQAIAKSGVGGRIDVSTHADLNARMLELRVNDDGPGIPAAIIGRIFEPFFTTKEVGEGTGIGLALCHRVVTTHGGEIKVGPGSAGGTMFRVRLPMAGTTSDGEKPAHDVAMSPQQGAVLIVEDEVEVAELLAEVLRRAGHEVDAVADGETALQHIARRDYALVLTDLNMPGLDGRALFEAIRREYPALLSRTAFVTADRLEPAAREFLDQTGRPCLDKPIILDELRALVAHLLAADGERTGARFGP